MRSNSLSSRILWLPKKGKILLFSLGETKSISSTKKKTLALVSRLVEVAQEEGASMIFGLGFSLPKNADLKALKECIDDSGCSFLAERKEQYVLFQDGKLTQVLEQQFARSQNSSEAQAFVEGLERISKKIPKEKNSLPLFLLVCGENNVFNRHNHGSGLTKRFAAAMGQISQYWCLFNPTHRPYKGGLIPQRVSAMHQRVAKESGVKWVLSGNNSRSTHKSKLANHPYFRTPKSRKRLRKTPLFPSAQDWKHAWYSIVSY